MHYFVISIFFIAALLVPYIPGITNASTLTPAFNCLGLLLLVYFQYLNKWYFGILAIGIVFIVSLVLFIQGLLK